jgi:hypothetical protein
MAILALASLAGSPGVTTVAVGAALNWPRPVILVEADTSKSSSILPGFLRGQVDHALGLTPLSVDHQRGDITLANLWAQTIELAPERYVIPGFSSLQAARGTTTLWVALGAALAGRDAAGVDVLVDFGRLSPNDSRMPLLQQADGVLLVARPVLPDVAALAPRVGDLAASLGLAGRDGALSLLLVDSASEGYSSAEITKALGVPVTARLAWDVRAATVYSLGATRQLRFDRSPLVRSLITATGAISHGLAERASKLGLRPTGQSDAAPARTSQGDLS